MHLENNFLLRKNDVPEIKLETSLFSTKEEPNFIAERPSFLKNERFLNVREFLKNRNFEENINKEKVTEKDLYEDNGGTTLSLIVDNKIIVASDTRHSSEYTINSRKMTKIYKVGNYFLTTTGFHADGFEIYNILMYKIRLYETYAKISLKSLAHLLHNVLYSRRFFPLYSYTCLSGFENGVAKIYSFDCIGSYQETICRCDGSGSLIVQPLLDSWISGKNFKNYTGLSFENVLEFVKKVFDGVAERDIKTKDFLEIYVIEEQSVNRQIIPLRRD